LTDIVEKSQVDLAQLVKYAEDLRLIKKENQAKAAELETLHRQLLNYAQSLNDTVTRLKGAFAELDVAYIDTVNRLARAAEYKDGETGGHITRMSRYSALLAEKAGLSPTQVRRILYASPMHDVGKIGIPEAILLKPGRLTQSEFETMKTHTQIGADILEGSRSDILKTAAEIALLHHEQWDGLGYPRGLSGDEIPIACRIVTVADTFDVLMSKRPYKDAYPVDVTLAIMKRLRGKVFDPDLTDLFIANLGEVLAIRRDVDFGEGGASTGFTWSDRDILQGIPGELAGCGGSRNDG
jgi:putative two-component system response regulator